MPSGGPRQGTPGGQYPNRSDMAQAPAAPKGQSYGDAGAQLHAQSVVPVAGGPVPPGVGAPAPSPTGAEGLQGAPGLAPGQVPSLGDPTSRPNEPVTAGLSTGPGGGPGTLGPRALPPPELGVLKAAYAQYAATMPAGGEYLRRLIEWSEQNV